METKYTPENLATLLATATVGQWVAMDQGRWTTRQSMRQITRTTKAIIEIGAHQFNRQGRTRGEFSYGSPRIYIVDAKHAAQIETVDQRKTAIERLGHTKWEMLPTETLKAVLQLVSAAPTPPKGTP